MSGILDAKIKEKLLVNKSDVSVLKKLTIAIKLELKAG